MESSLEKRLKILETWFTLPASSIRDPSSPPKWRSQTFHPWKGHERKNLEVEMWRKNSPFVEVLEHADDDEIKLFNKNYVYWISNVLYQFLYIYIWYMALTKGCVSKLGDLSWWNKLYWMYCTETLATFFLGEKTLYQISGKIDSFKTIIHSPRCIFRHFTRPKSWKFSETSAMLRYDKDFFSHIRFGGTCSPFLFSRSIFLGPPFQKWTTIVTTSVTTISRTAMMHLHFQRIVNLEPLPSKGLDSSNWNNN